MAGGGGKPNVVNYDPSFKEAELSAARTAIRDKTTYNAYKSAKLADVYRDLNIEALNEGMGLLSEYMQQRNWGAWNDTLASDRAINQDVPAIRERAKQGASKMTDGLLGYMEASQKAVDEWKGHFPGMS